MENTHQQFKKEMEDSYDYVDKEYDADKVLGARAAQVILRLACRSSVHEFPYGMSVLSAMPACANGALVEGFAGSFAPLSMLFFEQRRTSN